jgi:hypothetical protein
MAQSPIESNRLPGGTTESRISAAANLGGGVAGAFGSSRADAFDPSRYRCKISSVVGPWLVRTLAGTISLSTCENYMIHPFFGQLRTEAPCWVSEIAELLQGFAFGQRRQT